MFASLYLNHPPQIKLNLFIVPWSSKENTIPGTKKSYKNVDCQHIWAVNKKSALLQYVNKMICLKGEWDSFSQCAWAWASAVTPEVWHTHTRTHTVLPRIMMGIPPFSTYVFEGWVRGSLVAVSVEGGGSTTCKDTPLRQRGQMEVLQWLLGKQGGVWRRVSLG